MTEHAALDITCPVVATVIARQCMRAEVIKESEPFDDRVVEDEEIELDISPEGIKFPPVLNKI